MPSPGFASGGNGYVACVVPMPGRRDITWIVEAIRAANAVADVAHVCAPFASRTRCLILDPSRAAARSEQLALPPPRD